MAKISIHIPDETLAKVRAHKDRLNISRICSTALLREVEIISNVPPMIEETRKLIERLRKETQQQSIESFDLGIELAKSYLKKSSMDQLEYWGSLVFSEKRKLILPEEVEDYLESCLLEKRFTHRFSRQAFTRAWLSVMKQTWNTVKDKV